MIAGPFRYLTVHRHTSERPAGEWLHMGGSRDLDRCETVYMVACAYPENDAMLLDTYVGLVLAEKFGAVGKRAVEVWIALAAGVLLGQLVPLAWVDAVLAW